MPDNTKTFEAEKAPTLPYVVDRLFSMNQEYEEFVNNPVNKREKKKAVSFASMLRKQLKTRVWDRQEDQLPGTQPSRGRSGAMTPCLMHVLRSTSWAFGQLQAGTECVFSGADKIVTPKRNSLSPKQVEEKIVVLLILILS